MRVPPKYRLMRGLVRGSFKKAIVTLKPGKRISIVKTEK
jgi:ribosomal protein L23